MLPHLQNRKYAMGTLDEMRAKDVGICYLMLSSKVVSKLMEAV